MIGVETTGICMKDLIKMVMDMEIFHINTMFMLINYGFYNPNVKFLWFSYYGFTKFLAKFIPFSEPELLAVDNKPMMEYKIAK